ncbi:MAG: hypothetical protein P8Y24_13375 [Gammaproteobacteria bacterium]
MRFISLLLVLAILGYVIKIYLDTSVSGEGDEKVYTSRPQQTIEHAEGAAEDINRALQQQQKQMEQSDQ